MRTVSLSRFIQPATADDVRRLQPPPGKQAAGRLLAVAVAAVGLFGGAPAAPYLLAGGMPAWAQISLVLASVTVLYALWLATLPDWSTAWIGMIWFAFVATLYATAMAVLWATPTDREAVLELSAVRRSATGWCLASLLLTGLLAYVCGALSTTWRRSVQVLMAARTGKLLQEKAPAWSSHGS